MPQRHESIKQTAAIAWQIEISTTPTITTPAFSGQGEAARFHAKEPFWMQGMLNNVLHSILSHVCELSYVKSTV